MADPKPVLTPEQDWWKTPCVLGIDEAGRGPVLGPMVYGAAFCAVSNKERLAKAAYADSKTLTEEKRESLFAQLKADATMGWVVDSISAHALSTKMLRKCDAARSQTNCHAVSRRGSDARRAAQGTLQLERHQLRLRVRPYSGAQRQQRTLCKVATLTSRRCAFTLRLRLTRA
jgi:hypothetical protein